MNDLDCLQLEAIEKLKTNAVLLRHYIDRLETRVSFLEGELDDSRRINEDNEGK